MLLPPTSPELVKLDIDKQMMCDTPRTRMWQPMAMLLLLLLPPLTLFPISNQLTSYHVYVSNLIFSACATTYSAAAYPSEAEAMRAIGQEV